MKDKRPHEVLMKIRSQKGAVKRISAVCGISHAAVCQWRKVPAWHLDAVSRCEGIAPADLRPDLDGRTIDRFCPGFYPIEALPTDSTMVWAETADGRRMRWPASILRMVMSEGVPELIAFPAVRWSYSRGDVN